MARASGVLVGVALFALASAAHADPPLRTHEPAPRWRLDTNLPVTSVVKASPDVPFDPRLLARQLGLARFHTFLLAPGLELTLVNPDTLATLEILGKGAMSFTPTGFSSGVVTFTMPLAF